jgi:hypothetical protein
MDGLPDVFRFKEPTDKLMSHFPAFGQRLFIAGHPGQ